MALTLLQVEWNKTVIKKVGDSKKVSLNKVDKVSTSNTLKWSENYK
jgi:hypothetical protein